MRVPDPQQWATGLVVAGTLNIKGASKTPFVTLTTAPNPGDTALQCNIPPSGWQTGDVLVLPDSRWVTDTTNDVGYTPKDETATISSVSGNTVNLTAPLANAHPGVTSPDGNLTYFPQVANITRNIVLQSANPSGTRGHVALTFRPNVNVSYARFDGLGRTLAATPVINNTIISGGKVINIGTNQDGRYSFHFHHVLGQFPVVSSFQFLATNNVVSNGNKWGIAVHDSHFGCLKNNVVYKVTGAGIVTETGNETGNTINGNLVIRAFGYGGNGNENLGSGDVGSEGSCYWFRGTNNYVCNNFASECSVNGYMIFPTQGGLQNFPAYQGADTTKSGQYVTQDIQGTAVLTFANNTAYGAVPQGLAIWNLGVSGDHQLLTIGTSVILNTLVWHHSHYAMYGWGTANVVFDNFNAYGDTSLLTSSSNVTIGLYFADHMSQNNTVLRCNFQGLQFGISCPHRVGDVTNYSPGTAPTVAPFYVDTTTLRCYYNVQVETMYATGGSSNLLPRQVILHNCAFANGAGSNRTNDPQLNLWMNYNTGLTNPGVAVLDQTFVGNYNTQVGANFQAYYTQQAQTVTTPQSSGGLIGSPTAGLTNRQNWDSYQLCVGNALASPDAFTAGDGLVTGLIRTPLSPGVFFNYTTGILTAVGQQYSNALTVSASSGTLTAALVCKNIANATILTTSLNQPLANVNLLNLNGQIGVANSVSNSTAVPYPASIAIDQGNVNVAQGATIQFTASVLDQSGHALAVQPLLIWSVAGAGTISATGLYTAPGSAETDTVQATASSIHGFATVTVLQTLNWTSVSQPITNPGLMILLSDGTVMIQTPNTTNWTKLTPDQSGSYENGAFSAMAPMSQARLYFASNVLTDGRVFVVGGEYSGDINNATNINTGEIYDPATNSWASITAFPNPNFGDDPSQMLDDGTVLCGYILGPQTYIYHPSNNTWTQTGTKLRNDQSDEETWIKLPDGSILSYDIFHSTTFNTSTAQRYVPGSQTWVDAGTLPVQLSSNSENFELGPAFLLPDGRAIFFGATGNTAYYTPGSNTWAAGPVIPSGLVCDDGPGCMMPNGKILIATGSQFRAPPTTIFEFDPIAQTFVNVNPDPSFFNLSGAATILNMLMLPTGQVLVSSQSNNKLILWNPVGSPNNSWKPTIASVVNNSGTYTLTGTQLNGISEGACYGDDNEMATNYPLVRITDTIGRVWYAKTVNWSSTGVQTGNRSVTVQFSLPAGLVAAGAHLVVVASGIASNAWNM